MEIFLDVLTHEERKELLEKFMKIIESLSITPLQTLGQAVNIFRIKELFGLTFKLSVCGKISLYRVASHFSEFNF